MHVKRQTMNKDWPVPRKGTKYVIRASHEKKNGIPLLIVLRDVLKIAKNRKEVKKILQSQAVSLNGKIVKKENLSILPFDLIKIGEKNYELGFSEKGKFMPKETERKELILKIVGKKILKGKKVQLNLLYGKNIITSEKCKRGDSVVLVEKKVSKIISLEKGKEVIIFSGKYKGKSGKIERIDDKMVTLSYRSEKINIPVENIMVVK